jgi:hypothetical protein
MPKPNAQTQCPNQTTRTASKVNVSTSISQHQCHNIDSTLKTTKPTKTPKIPNRQKSQKPPKISAQQKPQKIPPKIPDKQKFPTNKNPQTKWNITKNSTIGSTRIILHYKSPTLTTTIKKK